nr:inner membrane metabolite transport protein YhjE [Raoultella sp. NCTC 9187]
MQATATTLDKAQETAPVNSRNKVVVASLIGTAIEFFDFYIYATAAVIVFPHIFFPQGDPPPRRYSRWQPSPLPSSRVRLAQRCSATSAIASVVR